MHGLPVLPVCATCMHHLWITWQQQHKHKKYTCFTIDSNKETESLAMNCQLFSMRAAPCDPVTNEVERSIVKKYVTTASVSTSRLSNGSTIFCFQSVCPASVVAIAYTRDVTSWQIPVMVAHGPKSYYWIVFARFEVVRQLSWRPPPLLRHQETEKY